MRWFALALILGGCGRVDFPSDGLIAAYSMDSLGPDGDRLTSETGRHDGTCIPPGCPTAVAGRIGNALAFDGVDDQIRIPYAPDLNTTKGYTIAAWIELAAPATHTNHIMTKAYGDALLDSWALAVVSDQTIALFTDTTTASHGLHEPVTIDPGTWHHVAGRWDGGSQQILLDGEVVASEVFEDLAWDENTVNIGADIENGARSAPFAGVIDDVRLYDHALDDDQIAALAAE